MSLPRALVSIIAVIPVLLALSVAQDEQTSPAAHQALTEAWWTGPMLAPSAATLPKGHFLIEPYLFDVSVQGRYDHNGVRRSVSHENDFGSLTYILYGVADKLSVGIIPTAFYSLAGGLPSSSGPGLGDITVQGQYRLAQFQEGHRYPTVSVAVQETFPTGRYDRLDGRAADGHGSGAYSTTLALYSQTYFWMPTHRILRMRLNLSQGLPRHVSVHDQSVYGTPAGFRGHAYPGRNLFIDGSLEYSVSRSWVVATDATYSYSANTRVYGYDAGAIFLRTDSGASHAFGLAPAIEYSWRSYIGILLGVRFIPVGRNTTESITPAVAINFVH